MFSSSPHYAKLKTNLRLVINRLKLLEKKKTETNLKARREISDYLRAHKPDRARIRVESIIREDNLVEALELIEMYADLCLARFGLIETQKDLDPGLEEAIATLIWAAPRLASEVQEMRVVAEQFAYKYGKEFAKECVTTQAIPKASAAGAGSAGGGIPGELKPSSSDSAYYLGQVPAGGPVVGGAGDVAPVTFMKVSPKVMSKMSVQAPPRHLVERYLQEISKTYNVEFTPDQRVLAEFEARSANELLLDLDHSIPTPPTMSAISPSHVPPPAANPNFPPAGPLPFQVPSYGPPPPIPSVPPVGGPMQNPLQFGSPPGGGLYGNAFGVMPQGGCSASPQPMGFMPPPGAPGFVGPTPPEYTSLPPDKWSEAARGGPVVGMNGGFQKPGADASAMNSPPPGGAPGGGMGMGYGMGMGAGPRPQYPGAGLPPPPSGGMLDLNLPDIPTDAPSGGANNGAPRDVDYDDIMRRFDELKKPK